ncbi:hypothetical protein FRC19_001253 [Serendipita sp. 401]|nr:hypothetical protein FRC19_001253 [Serendipita sp. 401]
MEGDPSRETTGDPASRISPATQQKSGNRPLDVNKTTSAWQIYNDRAFAIDKELIKEWNDSLNTLLIFAALYSAILTAFIVESMKLIQEDLSETSRDVLLVISRQLANNTVAAFQPGSFVAQKWAIRVNFYFFAAISCTLVTTLTTVLALQWVGSYGAGLNPSSPEGRALQRHFRHREMEQWHMVQIIAFLPALIYIALFLFFIGLAEWMWNVHQGVAKVIIVGLVCGAILFLMTTAISMVYVGAPFRTPVTRSLPRLSARLYYSAHKTLSNLTFRLILSTLRYAGHGTMKTLWNLAAYWKQSRPGASKLHAVWCFLQSPHSIKPFEEREKELAHTITDIKPSALVWLANSIDVLPHNRHWFQSILRELLRLPPKHLVNLSERTAPWSTIFTFLLDPHRGPGHTSFSGLFSQEESFSPPDMSDQHFSDREIVLQAFMLLGDRSVYRFDRTDPRYERSSVQTKFITTLGLCKQDWEKDRSNTIEAIHFMATAIESIGILPTNLIAANLLVIYDSKIQLKDFDLDRPYVYRVADDGHYTPASLSTCLVLDYSQDKPSAPFPDQIMEILLDIFALRFEQSLPTGSSPLERYISAAESFFGQGQEDHGVHDAITTQVVGGFLRRLEGDGDKPDIVSVLSLLLRLIQAKPTLRNHSALTTSILLLLNSYRGPLCDDDTWLLKACIYALILPSAYKFVDGDWTEWRVRFYTGLDRLSQTAEWSPVKRRRVLWERANEGASHHKQSPQPSNIQVRQLLGIRDPILRVYASIAAGSVWTYPVRLPNALLTQNEEVKNCLRVWNMCKRDQLDWSHSELLFTRDLILNHDYFYYICSRLTKIQTVGGNPMSSLDWLDFLRDPVLKTILCTPATLYTDLSIQILLRVCTYNWFLPEFRSAGGFEWLFNRSERLGKTRVMNLICLSLDGATDELDIVGWMQELYHLLARYGSVGGIQRSDTFVHIVNKVYSAQKQYRMVDQPHVAIVTTSTNNFQDTTHSYVSSWSEATWIRWQGMMEAILDGLRRGYLRTAPLESSLHISRDPDGFCSRW